MLNNKILNSDDDIEKTQLERITDIMKISICKKATYENCKRGKCKFDAWNSVNVSENVKMNIKEIFMNLMRTLLCRLLWNCLITKNVSRTLGTFKMDVSLTLIKGLQGFTNVSKTPSYNLGQKVGDKLTKLNKTGSSMESFTANFLQLFNQKTSKFVFLGGRLAFRH